MKDFLRRHVLHNFGLKLISLALAVGLWLAVTRDPVAEVAVDVPIEFHNIPQNLEISSENIPQAQIRLRGPERIVHRLQPSDVYAEIELSGMKPGERTFDLTAEQVRQADGTGSRAGRSQPVPSHVSTHGSPGRCRCIPGCSAASPRAMRSQDRCRAVLGYDQRTAETGGSG